MNPNADPPEDNANPPRPDTRPADRLDVQIEAIAARYGIELNAYWSRGRVDAGNFYDWPDAMYAEVKQVASLRHGPNWNYWIAR